MRTASEVCAFCAFEQEQSLEENTQEREVVVASTLILDSSTLTAEVAQNAHNHVQSGKIYWPSSLQKCLSDAMHGTEKQTHSPVGAGPSTLLRLFLLSLVSG